MNENSLIPQATMSKATVSQSLCRPVSLLVTARQRLILLRHPDLYRHRS